MSSENKLESKSWKLIMSIFEKVEPCELVDINVSSLLSKLINEERFYIEIKE